MPPPAFSFAREGRAVNPAAETGKPEVCVGVLGATGHGKTTLTRGLLRQSERQLTSTFIHSRLSRVLPEYLFWRGRPLAPGRLHPELECCGYATSRRHYLLFDPEGHRGVLHSLLTGAARMDAAVLVVAADVGVTAETREQVRLASWLGVEEIILFISKADLVREEPRLAEAAEFEARLVLSEYGYRGDDALAFRSDGNADVLAALDGFDLPAVVALDEQPLLFPVEAVFSISGKGTVVTGKVQRGRVRAGDRVEVVGFRAAPLETVVCAIETFGRLNEGRPGDNLGIMLRNVVRGDLERGQVLAAPGSIAAHDRFEAVVEWLRPEQGGRQTSIWSGYRPQLFLHSVDVSCTVTLLDEPGPVRPGSVVRVQGELLPESALALEAGFHFVLREGSRAVGCGVVTKVLPG
jgi:elongation factor Tu